MGRPKRGQDERECEEAIEQSKNDAGDRQAVAAEPALAQVDVAQGSAAEEDRGHTTEARENEKDADHEARDRLAAGDRRLWNLRKDRQLRRRRGLGHSQLGPAIRAAYAMACVRLRCLEVLPALACDRDGHE